MLFKLAEYIYGWVTYIILLLFGIKQGKKNIIRIPISVKGAKNIKIGNNIFIGKNSRLFCFASNNGKMIGHIIIGDYFCAQNDLYISSLSKVSIGNNVLVGSYVTIIDNNHVFIPGHLENDCNTSKPITIGNHVWIAEKSCILEGVTIGDDCIIGAGSVVTRDIPSKCIAVGNPARVIKKWSEEKMLY